MEHEQSRLVKIHVITNPTSMYTCPYTQEPVNPFVVIQTKFLDYFMCPSCRYEHHFVSTRTFQHQPGNDNGSFRAHRRRTIVKPLKRSLWQRFVDFVWS